ncbi:MAG: hypothetical protein IJT23_08140 [Clostridia bacterium]|nr:hypothetical protein [Clostridia bacterium]
MKLRKLMSLAVTAAMVMTSMAMSVPMASAETNPETYTFTEDFEGMPITNSSNAAATMDALFGDGWYPVTNNYAYASVDTTQSIYQFAAVMGDDTNHYLRIITPGSSTANYKYGLGRPFPGQGANARGIWEINFKFKPYKAANGAQFNFGLNTLGATVDETVAQHNILSAYANKMYLGYRDFMPLYQGGGVPQGRIDKNISLDWWYDVKVIVNCDARYYSVELKHDNTVMARRSAISFSGNETIGFFKLSALGMGKPSAVYVDDISIKPAKRETLIYNDDFESYSNVELATAGMETGGETEDVSGTSYFEGFTPWRAHKRIGNYYDLQIDPDLTSQVVRLGDGETAGSGLVYMIAYEKLLEAATQTTRGMVKTSFKIKPETIVGTGATVNAIADYTQDIADNKAVIFRIQDNEGTPALLTPEGNVDLNSEAWYNVDLTFDVINHNIETKVAEYGTEEEIASFTRNVSSLTALKGLMFAVPTGSSVLADDINIEYYAPAPVIDENGIVLTDAFGNEVADINSVTPALKSIKIPVGCTVKPETASAETIKLKDQNGNEVTYAPSRVDNAYTLLLDKLLAPNTTYTVTVPKTLANTFGDELGEDFTLTFKTTNALPYLMNISAVKLGGQEVTELSQISAGSTINVETEYANSTAEAIDGTVIVVFYSEDKMEAVLTKDTTIASGACGKDTATFAFDVPEGLDMTNVSKVSVMLWDGFSDITPYCGAVDIPAQAE